MRAGPYRPDANSAGRRALGNIALGMSVLANDLHMMALASEQVLHADNMTDRLGALHALGWAPAAARDAAIDAFERIYTDEPLALDKWFAHQAMLHRQPGDISVLDRVRALMHHPAFAARNPNRIRALIGSFCHGNLGEFHRPDGAGYEFWADQVADLDSVNPQIAARLARALDRWRKFTPQLQVLMAQALERVAESAQSPDVREIVTKALAAPPQAPQEHPK
jgi:aminopeptidase N